MKTLALSASLAVIATAAIAELKDPAEVAADWNDTIERAQGPMLPSGALGLTATPPASRLDFSPRATPPVHHVRPNGDGLEVPPGWQLDPKMLHGTPDDKPPPGAKPWYYRGQKYWLIPIDEPLIPLATK